MDALQAAFDVWKHLASPWHRYFQEFFSIPVRMNESEFEREMAQVRKNCRAAPGFEDFSSDEAKGIEPGLPAASLLYHAFASPSVHPAGLRSIDYLSEERIDTIENYIFAKAERSLDDLLLAAAGQPLALAVFTRQYRGINETTHGKHADLVFARTGVARVGNEKKRWNGRNRCWDSCTAGRRGMPVLPCRYSAWIAVKVNGDPSKYIPGRFQNGDAALGFWLPVHKVFPGRDCLRGLDIRLSLTHGHRNEKLRKIHRAVQYLGSGSGHSEPEIGREPFVETKLLDEFAVSATASCLVVPKDIIAEEVSKVRGGRKTPVTMVVPPNVRDQDSSFHIIPKPDRWAPEFVYVRDAIVNGRRTNLAAKTDISAFVREGGFEAVHHRDFTGDGWVRAEVPQLEGAIHAALPAYSILAPMDLVPNVRQADLLDWYNNAAPPEIKPNLWLGSSPIPLCDVRDAANVTLPQSGISLTDVTIAALVGFAASPVSNAGAVLRASGSAPSQTTALPDDASGIFAPGSEIGEDTTETFAKEDGSLTPSTSFFSNYGMGSPFLEDTKLCAAQSSFWPGTTPDTSRVYEMHSQPSVTPLLDEEIPWDGNPLPELLERQRKVRHRSRAHTDYVRAKFNFGLLADLSLGEYVERTVTMARVYQALGADTLFDRSQWVVLRFKAAKAGVQTDAACPPAGFQGGYFLRMYHATGQSPDPPARGRPVTTFLVSFDEIIHVFANSRQVWIERNGSWRLTQF